VTKPLVKSKCELCFIYLSAVSFSPSQQSTKHSDDFLLLGNHLDSGCQTKTLWNRAVPKFSCLNSKSQNLPSKLSHSQGKSLSEPLVFASTNPHYDDRLFIELQVQYMKIPSSNLGRTCCVQKLFLRFRTIFVHNMFSPCSAKRRASDKDLPVHNEFQEPDCFIKNVTVVQDWEG
jgi:hypothetical protein